MSKMKELYEKVSTDTALQEKLTGILSDAEKNGEEATKENLVQFARGEGFEIAIEEMQAFFNELAEKDRSELSAAELDMVAGGKATTGLIISGLSLGIGCIVMSIMITVGQQSCGKYLDSDLVLKKAEN